MVQAALDGWAAWGASLPAWLQHPEIKRLAVEDLLLSSFVAAMQSAARHDAQPTPSRYLGERLSLAPKPSSAVPVMASTARLPDGRTSRSRTWPALKMITLNQMSPSRS